MRVVLFFFFYAILLIDVSYSREQLTNEYTDVFSLNDDIYIFGINNSIEIFSDGKHTTKYSENQSGFICWANYGQLFLNIDFNHKLNVLDNNINLVKSIQLPDNTNDIFIHENNIYITEYPNKLLKLNLDEESYSTFSYIPNFIIDKIIKINGDQILFMSEDRSLVAYNLDKMLYKSQVLSYIGSDFNFIVAENNIYISTQNTVYKYNIINNELNSINTSIANKIILLQNEKVYLMQNKIDSLAIYELNFIDSSITHFKNIATNERLNGVKFKSYLESNNLFYLVGTNTFIATISKDLEQLKNISNLNSSNDRILLTALSDNELILNSSNRYTFSSKDGGKTWISHSRDINDIYKYEYGYIIPFTIDNIKEFFPATVLFSYKNDKIEKLDKPFGFALISDYGRAENHDNIGYICSFYNYANANYGLFTRFDSNSNETIRIQKKDTIFNSYLYYNNKDYVVAGISNSSLITGKFRFELFEINQNDGLEYISTIADSAHQSFDFFEKNGNFYLNLTDNEYRDYLLVSKDRGLTWERISMLTNDTFHDFNYSHVGNNIVYLTSKKFEVYYSTDLGDSWSMLDTKIIDKKNINSVEISENYIFLVTGDTQIYRYKIDQQKSDVEAKLENIPSVQLLDPFPNPSRNRVETKLYHSKDYNLNSLKVYDINGIEIPKNSYYIENEGLFTSSIIVNSNELAPGTYIIHIESNGVKQSRKFLITK